MSTKHHTNIPIALSEARHQLDLWRSQQPNKRTRLPQDLWRKAVVLAKEYGLNKTARALNVKYDSLRKHLHEAGAAGEGSVKPQPDFIELLPGVVTPGGVAKPHVECMIEWADGHNATLRMQLKGVGVSELTALARVFRSDRT